jgi:hypothetical protein
VVRVVGEAEDVAAGRARVHAVRAVERAGAEALAERALLVAGEVDAGQTAVAPRAALAAEQHEAAVRHEDLERAGDVRRDAAAGRRDVEPPDLDAAPGQQKGDSTSLQRECSARARSGISIYASRPFREMIARPKVSRNEWKTAEI